MPSDRSTHETPDTPSGEEGAPVSYTSRGAIRVLEIDRPERRNAVDRRTADALLAGFQRFEQDPEARVLVVGGKRGTFCAGADLKAMNLKANAEAGPMGFTRLRASKPTIAAVEGWCVAGGLEIALWCDLRVAGRSARFGCLERRWGVPLIDGGTQRLPRIVGLGRALDLVLTGRVIDADEALGMGLISRIVDDSTALEASVELAESIAAFPWSCVVADRAGVLDAFDVPLERGLEREMEHSASTLVEALAGAERFAAGTGRGGKVP